MDPFRTRSDMLMAQRCGDNELTFLCLESGYLTIDGVRLMSKKFPSLTSLNISNNCIGNEGMRHLCLSTLLCVRCLC